MKKNDLKRMVAEKAYNIAYGGKKHFATYDIVEKTPNRIGFISMAIGIAGLAYPPFTETWLSLALIIAGLAAMYITQYAPHNEENKKGGEALIDIFHKLHLLYLDVDSTNDQAELERHRAKLEQLQVDALKVANCKQIFGSDWVAHFKLFGQTQTKWFVDELGLTFWKDKMPRSLLVTFVLLVLCGLVFLGNAIAKGYVHCTWMSP